MDKMYLKYSDLVLAKKLGVFVYSNFRKIKFLYLASAWLQAMDGIRDAVWSEIVETVGNKMSVPSYIIDRL
jgi:hypothetical protein